MRDHNVISKAVIFTGSIIAITTFILLKNFLNGKIIDIPKGTTEGAIISIVGYVAIIVTTTGIALFLLFSFRKLISKSSNLK